MRNLYKQIDDSGVARLRSLETDLGDGLKLIALERRPHLSAIRGRSPAFQDLERDLDATLLVYFGAEAPWRQRD